uniref:Capsid protein n=1 Tax=Cruciviridae sp. TaxID=1955495 RepID=A0A1S6LVS1_9VIRU|nr:capsid protein [Cruciviridae sp.]AQU11804.1 capsid protein [Cruciviridae sp.]
MPVSRVSHRRGSQSHSKKKVAVASNFISSSGPARAASRFYYGDRNTTSAGRKMRSYGGKIGEYVLPAMGIPKALANPIGHGIGAAFSRITGNGAYVTHNSLMKNGYAADQASFGAGSIRIRHREYIQDITGSTAFNVSAAYEINPGLQGTFPFLSLIASNFETYKMHGLIFEYRSSSGDVVTGANSALGQVVMAVQYNSLNAQFSSKQQMEAYEGAVSTKPSCNMICGVECAKNKLPLDELYIRTGPLSSFQDEKFYDMGDFNLATQGMQGAYDVGELWVSYDVTLHYPKLNTGSLINSEHWASNTASGAGSIIPANLFVGNSLYSYSGTNDNMILLGQTGNVITFATTCPSGNYCIYYNLVGTSVTQAAFTITLSAGVTYLTVLNNDTSASITTGNKISATFSLCLFVGFQQNGTGTQTITLGGSPNLVTTPTFMDFIITQLDEYFA